MFFLYNFVEDIENITIESRIAWFQVYPLGNNKKPSNRIQKNNPFFLKKTRYGGKYAQIHCKTANIK